MRILVDTHIFLWLLAAPERLDDVRRYEVESPANEVFLSAISITELMIKQSIGRIDIAFDPIEMAGRMGLELLDYTGADAMALGRLPLHHRDPFDRMLIAQAATNRLVVMTNDVKFRKYDCKLI